jgi:hypothetical protein
MGGISNTTAITDGYKRGSVSFYLRRKALSKPQTQIPNMDMVRTTIKVAIATRRLDREVE